MKTKMTFPIFRKVLIAAMTIILPWLALAQYVNQPKTVWGAASNGVCAGVSSKQSDWPSYKNDFECSMELGNLTTNLMWVWFPPFEQRYEIELRGPDGNRIRQLKPLFHSLKTRYSGLAPLSTNSTSGSFDWFFLKDTFDIRTNGQFTLIASVRVNVFTNFGIGQSQMQSDPTYFLLPPVTNTFNISPEKLKK
jgi:hypothetical protein